MNNPGPKKAASQQTLDAALRWLERLRDDDIPEKELLAWLSWYEADEVNSRTFDELQELWRLSQGLSGGKEGLLYVERMQEHSWWDRWKWRAESWCVEHFKSAGDSVPRSWHPAMAWSAGFAAIVVVAAVVSVTHVSTRANRPASMVATPHGGLVSAMLLPDDSKIELAPRTTVAVAYSDVERRLVMSAGEANFVVAPSIDRPFVVYVDTLRVRAVGTQFNIHRVADRVVVTVIEGKIDVYRDDGQGNDQPPAESIVHVTAGQQFTTSGDEDPGSLSSAESHDALTWREGRLRFINVPLSEVIADVNRYVSRPIVIHDDELNSLTYTGTVFAESIDEWLSAIPREFPLVVVTESDRSVLVSQAQHYRNK